MIFKRAVKYFGLAWLATAALPGQSVMTRVSASASDAVFLVDGQVVTGSAVFTWPAGSKHDLMIGPMQNGMTSTKTRYSFQRWTASSGPLGSPANAVTITADPAIPWYRADLTAEYAVSLIFYSCSDGTACDSPGTVWVNQTAFRQNGDAWAAAGSSVTLEASPGPGYVFAGWVQAPRPALYSFQLTGPMSVYPIFTRARGIRLLTDPDGLQVLADRAPVMSPARLEWGWNTSHTLGVVSPQRDLNGRLWVFKWWSDNGAINHDYQMASGTGDATVTARFVPAVPVQLATDPPGLLIGADGVDTPSPRTFFWAPTETHSISAPPYQIDASGAPWVFRQWSSGGPDPKRILTVEYGDTGISLTAKYDPLSRIRVESVPAGLALKVDGEDCRTPCEIERPVGSTVRVSAPANIGVSEGERLDLIGWDGAADGSVIAEPGFRKITARYITAYRLTLKTDPDSSGGWRLSPGMPYGFFPAGATVSVGYEPARGLKFRAWGLDLSGTDNPSSISMDGPHAVMALLDRIPEPPAPPRVRNAAGETPSAAVAAGSIASLLMADLTDGTAEASSNPLPQALAGVTIDCAGYLVPLLSVSTGKVNFQVPSSLAPGTYLLKVHRSNAPELDVPLAVTRNAPGLFSVSRLDGSLVTQDSPARTGEVIVLFATGVGLLTPSPLDGFAVPLTPAFNLTDAVEVRIGDRVVVPEFAHARPGSVGVVEIAVRIPADAKANTLVVASNGVISNSLPLPLQ